MKPKVHKNLLRVSTTGYGEVQHCHCCQVPPLRKASPQRSWLIGAGNYLVETLFIPMCPCAKKTQCAAVTYNPGLHCADMQSLRWDTRIGAPLAPSSPSLSNPSGHPRPRKPPADRSPLDVPSQTDALVVVGAYPVTVVAVVVVAATSSV